MAKRILVPLDQTIEAESVGALVADMARGAGATVRLLHVAPVPDAIVVDGHVIVYADQAMARLAREAQDYLAVVELAFDGVPVERAVRFGTPATEILKEAHTFDADLIACTTGSRRAALGRVATQLIRRAEIPVLLLRARGERLALAHRRPT